MEKNLKIFFIVLAAAAVLLILWGIISYFSKGRRKGRAAEKKVAKTISKLGKKDNIRIINNVFLPLYNKTVEIDHLVFGRFGILVIERGFQELLQAAEKSSFTKSVQMFTNFIIRSFRTKPTLTTLSIT